MGKKKGKIDIPTSISGGVHAEQVVMGNEYVTNIIQAAPYIPMSSEDMLVTCGTHVENVIQGLRHKYDPNLYVHRGIENEINSFIDEPSGKQNSSCFVVIAPAGSGKTNLLCAIAQERAHKQPTMLIMGGSAYISARNGLASSIQEALEIASDKARFKSANESLFILDHVANQLNRDAIVLLDAINEHPNPVQMRSAIEDLLRKMRGKRIKLVVTCRDYYWGLFKGDFWDEVVYNELPSENDENLSTSDFSYFASSEHAIVLPLYLEQYKITGMLVGDALEQCKHPLLLRFFCEAYRGQDIGDGVIQDIRLKELFDKYWDKKSESIAERMLKQGQVRLQKGLIANVENYLSNVASYMLRNMIHAIPLDRLPTASGVDEDLDDPRSLYGRIRDEFIVLEEQEHISGSIKYFQVAFVYEEFMEYVMARSLLRDWSRERYSDLQILGEINQLVEQYKEFTQLIGVLVYLSIMLKEYRHMELWSLLLSKDDEKWQQVIFETLRKLPEAQIDSSVISLLDSLLSSSDSSIQKNTLDTLRIRRIAKKVPANLTSRVYPLAVDAPSQVRQRAIAALGRLPFSEKTLDVLISSLDDPKPGVRENALSALADLYEPRAINRIIEALGDRSPAVHSRAADVLIKQKEISFELLLRAIKHTNRRIRPLVVEILGRISSQTVLSALMDDFINVDPRTQEAIIAVLQAHGDDSRVVEFLVSALKNKNTGVSQLASSALSKLSWKPSSIEEKACYCIVNSRWDECLALGQRAVPAIIGLLDIQDRYVRGRLIEMLARLGDARAVGPLKKVLKADDFLIVRKAFDALSMLGETQVNLVEILISSSDTSSYRMWVLELLRDIPLPRHVTPKVVRFLVDSLDDKNIDICKITIEILRKIKGEEVIDALINAAESQVKDVYNMAIAALTYKVPEGIKQIATLLNSVDVGIRRKAVKILCDSLQMDFTDSPVRIVGSRKDVVLAFEGHRAFVSRRLVKALQDDDSMVRCNSAKILAFLEWLPEQMEDRVWYYISLRDWSACEEVEAPALPVLIRAVDLETECLAVLLLTITRIWRRTVPQDKALETELTRLFSRYLTDHNAEVRAKSIEGLRDLYNPEVIVQLTRSLNDVNHELRESALGGLIERGLDSLPSLCIALNNPDLAIRQRALKAIGRMDDGKAIERLGKFYRETRNDSILSCQVLAALVSIGIRMGKKETIPSSVLQTVYDGFTDSSPKVRRTALFGIVQLDKERAIEFLTLGLQDADASVQEMAIDEIIKAGSDGSASLKLALSSNNLVIRKKTIQALNIIDRPYLLEQLVLMLKDKDRRFRALAIESLEKYNWYPETEEEKKLYLITALMENRQTVSAEIIENLLRDDQLHLLGHVLNTICTFNEQELYRDVNALPLIRALATQGEKALEMLLPAFNHKDRAVREEAVTWLKKIVRLYPEAAIQKLTPVLKHSDWTVRKQAIDMLSQLDSSLVVPLLMEMLADENEEVRAGAIIGLGQKLTPALQEAIINCLDDPKLLVQRQAYLVLSGIDNPEVKSALKYYHLKRRLRMKKR